MNCCCLTLRSRFRWYALLLLAVFASQAHARFPGRGQRPLVVAYLGPSGFNGNPAYSIGDLMRNGGAALLDQINYAHASVVGGRCALADPKADLEATFTSEHSVSGKGDDPASPFRGYLHQLKELKQRFPNLKILISLEGQAANFREDAQPEHRHAFVNSCVDMFLRGHLAPGVTEPNLFDGIDVDWEFPQQQDAENFRALIAEFRQQMKSVRHGLKLAIAVGDQPQMQPGTDFHEIATMVDQIGIMNYDYAGPWNSTTGFLAPLFRTKGTPPAYGSVAESIAAYKKAGVPIRKLLMGMPFYGYQWMNVQPANNGLFQRGKGVAEDRPYRAIHELQESYTVFRNPDSQAPWLFDGANFWTFDDAVSIEYKAAYAARLRLRGIMIWQLGEDTADATLLTAAWRALRHQPQIPSESQLDAAGTTPNTASQSPATP